MLPTKYPINEIFTSVQGEGVHAGKRATFIRLQGCSVGCSWCDTKRAWNPEGAISYLLAGEIVEEVQAGHVVITGGEPTLWDLEELLFALKAIGVYTQIETSGQNALTTGLCYPEWITWSPKPALGWSCHPQLLGLVNEVKMVVDDNLTDDLCVQIFHNKELQGVELVLMPEGSPPTKESYERTLTLLQRLPFTKHRQWRISPRLHYLLGVR